jgi:outer membrane usher protein
LRYQAGASAPVGTGGSVALSWIGEKEDGLPRSDLVTASYSLTLSSGWVFALTGLRNIAQRTSAAQFFLSMPLGPGIASASASTGSAKPSFQTEYNVPANPDGGFGYRVIADSQPRRAEADATWIGQQGEIDGAVAEDDDKTAFRADASGSIVMLGGDVYAARQPNGAVALVDAGAPDIRIYRDNREVATSDDNGKALLTDLNPYSENRIGIEPRDYPMSTVVAETERIVVPPRNAGVLVDLAPVTHNSFVAVIRLDNGGPPPVGARVYIDGLQSVLMVGRGGDVFVGDLSSPSGAQIEWGRVRCHVRITPPVETKVVPRAGPFVCESANAS